MATTATLHPDLQRFPVGTTVKAYKRSNFLPASGAVSGAPQGSQDASATVASDGSVSFTGLTDATNYVLYASVSGEDRYARFSTKDTPSTSGSLTGGTYSGAQDFSGATVTLPSGLVVPANSVDTSAIQNLAVTTGKIANGAVTAAKVAADVATQAKLDAAIAALGAPTSGRAEVLAPYNPTLVSGVSAPGSSWLAACRVTAGKTGTLHDLAVYIGTTSGNLRVGVYDIGETTAGSRTPLYDSGSVASPGTGWQKIADPSLAVVAGRQYDLCVYADNGTITFGRISMAGVAVNTLPPNFIPATGAGSPKLNWIRSIGAFGALPVLTEAQADATNISSAYCIIGRIS